jgi:hypothetical protein
MPPTWLTIIAWISLASAFVSVGAILFDIYARGLRQPVRVMEAVWPITALYLGPLGLLAYARIGRPRMISRTDRDSGKHHLSGRASSSPQLIAAQAARSATSSASGRYSQPRW